MMQSLLEKAREALRPGYEKNYMYKRALDKDDWLDSVINQMTNVELLELLDSVLETKG